MGVLTDGWRRVRGLLTPEHPGPPSPNELEDVPAVVARLEAIGAGLPESDGVACFNAMYLTVTERVGERLTGSTFRNPEFVDRLDRVFAALYFDAVDAAEGRWNRSWAPLFELRSSPGRLPVQFAVAGMNAHINHDLSVATVRTCQLMGLPPSDPVVRADYDRVNDVLAEVYEQVRASLLPPGLSGIDPELSRLLAVIGSWKIGRARDAAWHQALVMWELRRSGRLVGEYRDTLAGTVGLVTRQLLVPARLPR